MTIPTLVDRRCALSIALVLISLFALLIARFYVIQVLEHRQWWLIAQKQHTFIVKDPFLRGVFYANTNLKKNSPAIDQVLVVDVPKFHLYADPQAIPVERRAEISRQLSIELKLSLADEHLLREQLFKKSRSRQLVPWLDHEMQQRVQKWWQLYAKEYKIARNALFFIKDYQRSYPFGSMLGQVLHTVRNQKDEGTRRAQPTGGLELYFDPYLQGKQGKRRLLRSPRHALEMGEILSYPENGADVYLTIEPFLQAIAEEEIAKGVKKANAKAGWAVLLDPYTGEIWALAQYPFFNPTDYQDYFNDPQRITHTKVKAITDANEPGSVFKPFTAALALKANHILMAKGERPLFSTEEKIATSNGQFPGRSRPLKDTSLHRYLNFDMAMQKSSNIYMGRLAERIVNRLGADWYRQQLVEIFGFGQRTGIELPAESPGVLPKPGKCHPNGALEWSTPTPFSLAMGYNVQTSSLQLARAYAVLANGGYLIKPTLVRQIIRKDRDGKGGRIDPFDSPMPVRVLEADIVARDVRAMRFVTKPGGTAVRADIPGYTEAGKTSTTKKNISGEYSESLYCATFAGFAPARNPRFVLVIMIDEPTYGYVAGLGKLHHGGHCAAPVFREIAKRTLHYLGVAPDDIFGYASGDPRRNPDRTEWMTETRKLQEIYDTWNKK